MEIQALFSSKDKSKIIKCCLLQFLFGALRVNCKGGINGNDRFPSPESLPFTVRLL